MIRAWLDRRRTEDDRRVLALLARAADPRGLGFHQLCRRSTMSSARVDGALQRLVRDGRIDVITEDFGEREVTSYRLRDKS